MIAIVDYKLGNSGSVFNMLRYLGYESIITSDKEKIKTADKIILPGVGSFDTGIQNLRKLGLFEFLIRKAMDHKTPLLGICLGMQLLGTSSGEGIEAGLGLIPGKSVRFDPSRVKVPNIGWNEINIKPGARLFKNTEGTPKFYFAHSFHFMAEDKKVVIADSFSANNFTAAIEKDNIVGVQFHPEKSHRFGMNLLKNFVSEY